MLNNMVDNLSCHMINNVSDNTSHIIVNNQSILMKLLLFIPHTIHGVDDDDDADDRGGAGKAEV